MLKSSFFFKASEYFCATRCRSPISHGNISSLAKRTAAWIVSRTGDSWLWGLILLFLWWQNRPLGILLFVVLALTAGLVHILKGVFKRKRPHTHGREISNDKYSFPSGHAARVGAVATILAFIWPQWSWFILIWALLVPLSRVVRSRHYLADVIVGLILGFLIGLTTQFIYGQLSI